MVDESSRQGDEPEVTVPKPPDPPEKAEAWWTDTRKILLTQVLTLLLTPLSVATTLYLTESYKAPRPRIEYVNSVPYYNFAAPSAELRARILKESRLVAALRVALAQRNAPSACQKWLDGDSWDYDCETPLKASSIEAEGQLNDLTAKMRRGSPPPALALYLALMFPDLRDAQRALNVIADLRKDLERVSSAPRTRSGEVEFPVGVLNAGDSDGTVFKIARLKFDGGEFNVFADSYVAAKAHSFVEVKFKTAGEENGSLYGNWTRGEEPTITKWANSVRKGDAIPYTLTLTMSDKHGAIVGTLDKE